MAKLNESKQESLRGRVKFGCYTSPKMGKGIDCSGSRYVVGDEHNSPRLKFEAYGNHHYANNRTR